MLVIEDLHAGYASARVLDGTSLCVKGREVVALLGRNGMGKTTLLRAISGLHPPTVTEGSIRFDDQALGGRPSHEVARLGVSLVPQGRRVFRSLSVLETSVLSRVGTKIEAAMKRRTTPSIANEKRFCSSQPRQGTW